MVLQAHVWAGGENEASPVPSPHWYVMWSTVQSLSLINGPCMCGCNINTVTHLENRQGDRALKGTMTKSSAARQWGGACQQKASFSTCLQGYLWVFTHTLLSQDICPSCAGYAVLSSTGSQWRTQPAVNLRAGVFLRAFALELWKEEWSERPWLWRQHAVDCPKKPLHNWKNNFQ